MFCFPAAGCFFTTSHESLFTGKEDSCTNITATEEKDTSDQGRSETAEFQLIDFAVFYFGVIKRRGRSEGNFDLYNPVQIE